MWFGCAAQKSIVQKEGIGALFKGGLVRAIWTAPQGAMNFCRCAVQSLECSSCIGALRACCITKAERDQSCSSPSAAHEQLSLRKHCIDWKGLEVF